MTKTKPTTCTHTRQHNHICMDCKAPLCTHYHRNLRGCMLNRCHAGDHHNPNINLIKEHNSFTHWTDADGYYINNKADWVDHVHRLATGAT